MNLSKSIRDAVAGRFPDLASAEFQLQPTPGNQTGDFGFPCFAFAKALRQSPQSAAAELAAIPYPPPVTEARAVGPYVNLTVDRGLFAAELVKEVLERGNRYGSDCRGAGKKALLEHTSINPNASPHIGRARNGLIGDSLARLLRFEGYEVDVHYYVNDMGKQIAFLALETEGMERLEFHEVLDLYVRANERAKNDPDYEARALDLLMRMENGDPEVRGMFRRVVDICLDGQLGVLGRLGLSYDTFDRESSFLVDPRMENALKILEERGALFTDDQGRKVADLSALGYEREEGRYVVLVRANGSSMYMYRDIAYTLEKIARADGLDIVVLGEDHTMYFEQLVTILRAMGADPPEAVHYSYILLREGKMSTRQGNVVLLEDFLAEAVRRAREKVDEQWPDLPDAERGDIARMIGIGAVRFAVLSVRPNRNVIFDWETALSFTGDSGPYILYSCTRISSILRKNGGTPTVGEHHIPVTHEAEWSLLSRLAAAPDDIAAALDTRNPGIVANAALDIARRFNVFYRECPVLSAGDPFVRAGRLLMCAAVRRVIENLLALLGIEAPERM